MKNVWLCVHVNLIKKNETRVMLLILYSWVNGNFSVFRYAPKVLEQKTIPSMQIKLSSLAKKP